MKPYGSADIPSEPKTQNKTGSSFGKWGWGIVILQGALFWFANGATNDGLNLVIPALSKQFHIQASVLLFWTTPAALGTVLSGFASAWLCRLISVKRTIILTLVLCAICFGLLGILGGVIPFTILFFVVSFCGSAYAFVAGPVLITRWFPKKKELALGWATMGQCLSSATFVPILAVCFTVFGTKYGFLGVSVGMLILAGISLWLIKDFPEERGCTPDNLPALAPVKVAGKMKEKAGISMRQLVKMRDLWLIAFGTGGIYILLSGVMGQMIPRLTSIGIGQGEALSYLAILAIVGIPGSYLWGWMGNRYGVKRSLVIYSLWWMLALIINILFCQYKFPLYLSLLMIGLTLGGGTNLTTSICAEKFPKENFIPALSIISPMYGILRCCCFAILAAGLAYLGGFTGAYAILAGVALVTAILFAATNLTPIESKE